MCRGHFFAFILFVLVCTVGIIRRIFCLGTSLLLLGVMACLGVVLKLVSFRFSIMSKLHLGMLALEQIS